MTTYTANPTAANQTILWGDQGSWREGVVPNGANADVIVPVVTYTSGGIANYDLEVEPDRQYATRSLSTSSTLELFGNVSVTDGLSINRLPSGAPGGGAIELHDVTLTAGSILADGYMGGVSIIGDGIVNAGRLDNEATILGYTMTINATTYVGAGTLEASNGLVRVNVAPGGFGDMVGGTLVQGALFAESRGTLVLDVGSLLTELASAITFHGGTITSVDPTSGREVALTSSLHKIDGGGVLTLESAYPDPIYQFDSLDVAGSVHLVQGPYQIKVNNGTPATLRSAALTIERGGVVDGLGTIGGTIRNDGTITAGVAAMGTLIVSGTVSGAGMLQIGKEAPSLGGPNAYDAPTLELNGAVSQAVNFLSAHGTLQIDQPLQFSGRIGTTGGGDTILLQNIAYGSVTSTSYRGDASGGTLTIDAGANRYTLDFSGYHVLGDFTLSAGPQQLSTSPPFLSIVVAENTGSPAADSEQGRIYRLYETIYGRVPDPDGLHYFADQLAQGVSLTTLAQGFLGSQEAASHYAGTSNGEFVTDLYQTAYHRAADPDGLHAFTTALDNGSITRADLVVALTNSDEQRGYTAEAVAAGLFTVDATQVHNAVELLYEAGYGRMADPGGLQAFEREYAAGYDLKYMAGQVAGSDEFVAKFGQLDDKGFIDQIYREAYHREVDPGGEQAFLNELQHGTTRGYVLWQIAGSAEHQNLIGLHSDLFG